MPLAKGAGFLMSSVLQKKAASTKEANHSVTMESLSQRSLFVKEKTNLQEDFPLRRKGCRHCRRHDDVIRKQIGSKKNMIVTCIRCEKILVSMVFSLQEGISRVVMRSCCSELHGKLSKVKKEQCHNDDLHILL